VPRHQHLLSAYIVGLFMLLYGLALGMVLFDGTPVQIERVEIPRGPGVVRLLVQS
jgi:hypothetical protein